MHTKDLTHSINNTSGRMTNNNPLIPDVPFHLGPVYRPLPKPIKQDMSYPKSSQSSTSIEDINPNINFDFEENSPFQEDVMSETFQRLDKSFFQEANELGDLINKGNLTLSTPHMTIVTISHLVKKVPSLELLHATEFSMRLV